MSKVETEDWVDNVIEVLRDLSSRIFDIEKELNQYNYFADYELEIDALIDLLEAGKIKVKEIDRVKQRVRNIVKLVEELEGKHNMSKKDQRRRERAERRASLGSSVGAVVPARTEVGTPSFRAIKGYHLPVILQEGKCVLKNSFEVHISRHVYAEMMAQCKLLDTEITWLMEAHIEGGYRIEITDIHLFRQKVSTTTCESDGPDAQVELMDKMIKAGKNPADLKVWCHSHNTMDTGPSSQDNETSKLYKTKTWMLTLIVNHKGEFFTRLNIYEPIEMQIEEIPVYVNFAIYDEQMLEQSKDKIRKYVKAETYFRSQGYEAGRTPSVYQNGRRGSYGAHNGYGYGYHDDYDGWPYGGGVRGADAAVDVPVGGSVADEEGPFGDEFFEGGVKFTWDKEQGKYRMYDNIDRVRELTEDEVKEMGVTNWNEVLEEENAERTELGDEASRFVDEGGGD